jgi:rfaE bifunctional protein kinase chain/domain
LDAVIFQDYEKGLFHPGNIPTLIKACKDLAVKIIVDPKDKNFWNYKGVDLIKPNKKEAESALKGKLGLSEELLTDAAKKIVHNLENELTVITLSENGIFIKSKTDSIWQRSVTQNVVDVCGAGDAVISIVAAAWCSGLGLEDMATLSNLAGGIVCSERGVAAISLNGLKLAYENR